MLIFIICWGGMNAWYLSLNTRLFSSEDFACKLRNKNEYQSAGVQGEGLYYSRMITKPSDTKCVVQYTVKWLPMSGVEGHSTHWRLLVFSIKYGQSNAQFTRGSWSWRLYSRKAWGTERLEGPVTIWLVVLLSSKKEWMNSTYFSFK